LLLGYYDRDGKLRYASQVGTGFDRHTLTRSAGTTTSRPVGGYRRRQVGKIRCSPIFWTRPKA